MASGSQRRGQTGTTPQRLYQNKAIDEGDPNIGWAAPLLAMNSPENPGNGMNSPAQPGGVTATWDTSQNPIDTVGSSPGGTQSFPIDQNPVDTIGRPGDKRPLPWYAMLMNQN